MDAWMDGWTARGPSPCRGAATLPTASLLEAGAPCNVPSSLPSPSWSSRSLEEWGKAGPLRGLLPGTPAPRPQPLPPLTGPAAGRPPLGWPGTRDRALQSRDHLARQVIRAGPLWGGWGRSREEVQLTWASRAWLASSRASMEQILSVSCEFCALASSSCPWTLLSSSHLFLTSASEDCSLPCSSAGREASGLWGTAKAGMDAPGCPGHARGLPGTPLTPGCPVSWWRKSQPGFLLKDSLGQNRMPPDHSGKDGNLNGLLLQFLKPCSLGDGLTSLRPGAGGRLSVSSLGDLC